MSQGFRPSIPFGVASTRLLLRSGRSERDIAHALDIGELLRVRRGWFMARGANADALEALYIGGRMTGPSAAPHHGLWAVDDKKLHVLVPRNASRLRLRPSDEGGSFVDRSGREVCLHWETDPPSGVQVTFRPSAIVDARVALADSARCQPREHVIAMADSALNLKILTRSAVAAAIPTLYSWCDGRSQSGTESIERTLLRARRIRAIPQAYIPGVGHVDLLIGDRLVIECDSAKFHEGYGSERDYDRDLRLVALGYLVVRLKYRHVVYEQDTVEPIILELVRSQQHLWSRGSGRSRGRAIAI